MTSAHWSKRQFKVLLALFCLISSLLLTTSRDTKSFYAVPGISHEAYIKQGDINIGAFISVYSSSMANGYRCDIFTLTPLGLQRVESIAFAVEMINNDSSLLPNVSLGFVILDECDSENTALAQSLSFLPTTSGYCNADNCTGLQSSASSMYSSSNAIRNYDVIGVLSPAMSNRAVPISLLYSLVRVSLMSYSATSDELSVKSKHQYFMRVVPPDQYQVKAMIHFIRQRKWSYISVVYHSGSYGETAFDNIKSLTSELGICIATSHKVDFGHDMEPVAKNLMEFPRARVVILFTNSGNVKNLMLQIRKLKAAGHFIWIGSDAWASRASTLTDVAEEVAGAFLFSFFSTNVPEFENYFRSQRPSMSSNPWMITVWEKFAGCSIVNNTCDLSLDFPDAVDNFAFEDISSNVIDAVFAFAHAAHQLLRDLCPGASGQVARNCITSEIFKHYLYNVSFQGYTGKIQFDKNGDVEGKYQIRQIIPGVFEGGKNTGGFVSKPVAMYDIPSSSVQQSDTNNISWEYFHYAERIVPLPEGESSVIPESVCSRPCVVGEYMLLKKLVCCWECRSCRDNERLLHHLARCEACPKYTWPDPDTKFTTCKQIPVSYLSTSDTLSVILICLTLLAVFGTCLLIAAYIYFREEQVIKAASRELSFLQLAAILVGYVTVIIFQITPTDETCMTLYYMFCLSFTWLYAPLIVKAVRIFRIFQSGKKYNLRPRFVSPRSQLLMAAILIALQVIICISVSITYRPSATLNQPITTDKFVELSCDLTLPGLVSFLAYNIVLVAICSVFAFKTRKLPDNFNESRFMSMCVSSTLVIWLAFIPTYLTATYQYVRVVLLSAALLLNHTVALVFLFIPKIYASVCLPPVVNINLASNRFQSSLGTARSSLHPHLNQVSPHVESPPRPGF